MLHEAPAPSDHDLDIFIIFIFITLLLLQCISSYFHAQTHPWHIFFVFFLILYLTVKEHFNELRSSSILEGKLHPNHNIPTSVLDSGNRILTVENPILTQSLIVLQTQRVGLMSKLEFSPMCLQAFLPSHLWIVSIGDCRPTGFGSLTCSSCVTLGWSLDFLTIILTRKDLGWSSRGRHTVLSYFCHFRLTDQYNSYHLLTKLLIWWSWRTLQLRGDPSRLWRPLTAPCFAIMAARLMINWSTLMQRNKLGGARILVVF